MKAVPNVTSLNNPYDKYDIFNAPQRTQNDCLTASPRIPGAND